MNGGSPGKRPCGGTPVKLFKTAKRSKSSGRRIEIDETARVVRVFGTVFHERGILQFAFGTAAREAGQGFVYDKPGGFWSIGFDNVVEWGVNADGEDITEDDITEEYIKNVLDNSPGAAE